MKQTVLQRMAAGDEQACTDCLEVYEDKIRGMARSWFTLSQDVDDIVQDVFIELWKSAHRFDPDIAPESSFVKMITRRQMINRLRRNKRKTDISIPEGMDFVDEDALAIETNLDAERIGKYIDGFKADQRKVMSLFFKLGMSHGEISESTRIALGTVKSHIRRGVHLLRDRLELPVAS